MLTSHRVSCDHNACHWLTPENDSHYRLSQIVYSLSKLHWVSAINIYSQDAPMGLSAWSGESRMASLVVRGPHLWFFSLTYIYSLNLVAGRWSPYWLARDGDLPAHEVRRRVYNGVELNSDYVENSGGDAYHASPTFLMRAMVAVKGERWLEERSLL